MVNFDALPQENPNTLPTPGVYKGTVTEATMKQPNDAAKPPYLNLKINIRDEEGKNCGNIYDMLFDSDAPTLMYKLGRFLSACKIPLQGQMELKDIAKLVVNKEFAVDVKIDISKDPKYQDKAVVDIFSREAYYPIEQFPEIWGLVNKASEPKDASFVNVPETASAEQVPFETTY